MSLILSSYSTHLMQFLNVVCFQSFKYYHRQALDWSFPLGVFNCNWLDFIADFNKIRAKIFKSSTILSGFKETGLIFYNPENVLTPLREKLKKLVYYIIFTSLCSFYCYCEYMAYILEYSWTTRLHHQDVECLTKLWSFSKVSPTVCSFLWLPALVEL